MNKLARLFGAVVVGAVLGFVCGKYANSVGDLIVWAIAGLAVGAAAVRWRESLLLGALYGFALSFVFLLADYTGPDPVSSVLVGFVVLSVFGAICGLVSAIIGYAIRRAIKRPTPVS